MKSVTIAMFAMSLLALDTHAAYPEAPQATDDLPQIPRALLERAGALRDLALKENQAYEIVRALTVEVGPRLAGSEGDRAAVAWALTYLNGMGFDKVYTQPVEVPRWERGEISVSITEPFPQELAAVALGGSVGTPDEGITAPLVAVESLEALAGMQAGAVAGRIVYIGDRMRRTQDGSGYGDAVKKRTDGAAVAARLGARALVIRSVGTSANRLAHTGTTRYEQDVRRIPAVAISNSDADMLEAQLESGLAASLHLRLTSRDLPPARSANVIVEVTGDGSSDEIVLLAAHLDAWDLGTGALDDGAGVAIVTESARLISQLPVRPKRTIRVLLSANEEFGLSGATAYAAANSESLSMHVLGLEADLGSGPVLQLESRVLESEQPLVAAMHQVLAPLGVTLGGNNAGGGADLSPMRKRGMPVLAPHQDASTYFDFHHTANDTLDKISKEGLNQNVAVYAALTLLAAELPERFTTRPAEVADQAN